MVTIRAAEPAGAATNQDGTAMYELEGTIKVVFDTMTFNSGFTKREFVVTTEDKYPQDIKLQCVKEKVELLDSVQAGDKVKVSFDLRGNEYQDRYYVDLQAWRIEKLAGGAGGKAGAMEEDLPVPGDDLAPDEDDNLPF